MIDINELRRLAKAATPGPWKKSRAFELGPISDTDDQSYGIVIPIADVYGDNKAADIAYIAAANPAAISELLDRLEEAEKDIALKEKLIDALGLGLNAAAHERDNLRAEAESWKGLAQQFGNELDTVRAKIAEMEKQEPVAWLHETRRDSDVVTDAVKHVWGKAVVGSLAAYSIPLYLAPGAKGE